MEGQVNKMVPVKHATDLPYKRRYLYKMNSQRKLQDVLVKVGGTLFWDWGAWNRRVEKAREDQVRKAKQLREVNR